MVITHGLRCTCAHHARQCPAREADSVLCCACGDNDIFCVNGFQCVIAVFLLDIHCNHIVVIQSHGQCVDPELYMQLCAAGTKFFSDINAADACPVHAGTEKLVNLFEQLAAHFFIGIYYQYLYTGLCSLNRCGQSGRAAADNEHLIFSH